MKILNKIYHIAKNVGCSIHKMYEESARVARESMQNQLSAIDNLEKTPDFMKVIYKADIISKTLEGRALLSD